ncbi:hypothetical protein BS47DRAFT_1360274 [Hydnum rufescens UP504]|uniref:Uncharacterized protein n=1 Tax=Hydnum rufescens UP504 TaxID=1448309 RepID=A0A9P6B2B5_9AGAM|nr:hypothetical protein BS47DRAFT_1360274 [Hydnum rufescens UP504]
MSSYWSNEASRTIDHNCDLGMQKPSSPPYKAIWASLHRSNKFDFRRATNIISTWLDWLLYNMDVDSRYFLNQVTSNFPKGSLNYMLDSTLVHVILHCGDVLQEVVWETMLFQGLTCALYNFSLNNYECACLLNRTQSLSSLQYMVAQAQQHLRSTSDRTLIPEPKLMQPPLQLNEALEPWCKPDLHQWSMSQILSRTNTQNLVVQDYSNTSKVGSKRKSGLGSSIEPITQNISESPSCQIEDSFLWSGTLNPGPFGYPQHHRCFIEPEWKRDVTSFNWGFNLGFGAKDNKHNAKPVDSCLQVLFQPLSGAENPAYNYKHYHSAWSIKITKTGVLDLNKESQTYKGNRSTEEEPSCPQSMKISRNERLFKPRSSRVTKSHKQSQVLCLSAMLDVPYESLLNYKATSLPYSNGPESTQMQEDVLNRTSWPVCISDLPVGCDQLNNVMTEDDRRPPPDRYRQPNWGDVVIRDVMGSKQEYGFKDSVKHCKWTIKTVAQDPKTQSATYAGIHTGLGLKPAPDSIQIKGLLEPHGGTNATNKVIEVSMELLRAASAKGRRYHKPVVQNVQLSCLYCQTVALCVYPQFGLRSKVTGPVGAADIASSATFKLPESVIHFCRTCKGMKGLLSKEGICPWSSDVTNSAGAPGASGGDFGPSDKGPQGPLALNLEKFTKIGT